MSNHVGIVDNGEQLRGRRLFLIGPSGSGKTAIAKQAAVASDWALYDTDAQILATTGCLRISDIFDMHGEKYFRNLERECLESVVSRGDNVVVATGGGLPAIPGAMMAINAAGRSVYLKASLDTLWKRLSVDPRQLEDRPLLRDGGVDALHDLLCERETAYAQAAVILDTDQLSLGEACALVVTQIGSMEVSPERGSEN